MREQDAILELWREARGREEASALATVCEVKGSAYRRPGARMLLTAGGESAGIINGGCLDSDLWRAAREVMASGDAKLLSYDTTSPSDIVWGLGLGCRGVVRILVEPARDLGWLRDGNTIATHFEGTCLGTVRIEPAARENPRILQMDGGRALVETLQAPPPFWIFGAGADAAPLSILGSALGWAVEVVDLRAQSPGRLMHLPSRSISPERLTELEISPRAACVVMTHNFLHDLAALQFLLGTPARYIGVLGPRARTDELLARLRREMALSREQLRRVYAPVGLDIGAETPEEIALSILSEIRAVIAGRSGGFLRDRAGSIHKSETARIGIVILAAGRSSRLGEPKQLLPLEGKSLLRRTVEAAIAAQCEAVAVVIGAGAELMRAELADSPVRIVENGHWSEGLSTSVRAGLEALEAETDAVIFVPCDQPAFDADVLNNLVAAHECSGKPIVVSAYGEAWGAPMLVARRFWPELKALEGDRGAQPVAYRHPEQVESVPFPEGACDIDTREDYEALLKATLPMNINTPGEAALQTIHP